MTLGRAPEHGDLLRPTTAFCDEKLSPTSIHALLHRECHRLFPDDAFADLYADVGRTSVPPRILAVVMVLQRLDALSDREAVDRFLYDMRWKYAAGGLGLEYPGFVHTVLVDMRARLRDSKEPDRIFRIVVEVAKEAGLVGRRRVLDSTPLYDAVATQDTVTMIRASVRGLLAVVPFSRAPANARSASGPTFSRSSRLIFSASSPRSLGERPGTLPLGAARARKRGSRDLGMLGLASRLLAAARSTGSRREGRALRRPRAQSRPSRPPGLLGRWLAGHHVAPSRWAAARRARRAHALRAGRWRG
jgi:hypothetical protein